MTLEPWPQTWLFTPADRPRMLDSALRSDAQALIVDLEDAVAPEHKDLARERAIEFLSPTDASAGKPLIVRINDPHSDHGRNDLKALSGCAPTAVMVPKASAETVELALATGAPRVVALIESARGVSQVEQIARMQGVSAMAIGTVDLSAELGLRELPGGLELLHVRSRLVLACALGGIPAIDGVHIALADSDGLRDEAHRARALGFAGKLCIHPAQLAVVRAAFTPSEEELVRAGEIVEAYRRSLEAQHGVALADGEMVDIATVRRAERILGAAR